VDIAVGRESMEQFKKAPGENKRLVWGHREEKRTSGIERHKKKKTTLSRTCDLGTEIKRGGVKGEGRQNRRKFKKM